MPLSHKLRFAAVVSFSAVALSACQSWNPLETQAAAEAKTASGGPQSTLDPSLFVAGALASEPTIVDCTLEDGSQTTCYKITATGVPAGQVVGPFCPSNISDNDPDNSGIWFHESGTDGIVDLKGSFIEGLATTYNDDKWKLYDDATGAVRVTDTQVACEGAARPDVAEEYKNYCVECAMDYIDGGIAVTYLIPTAPVPADELGRIRQVGVALNGIELSAPAPVNDILSNYTIAAFDDCGGHINTHQGYHYHAATGCSEVGTQEDGHAALLGYALDGYGIYGMRDANGEEEMLDECRGTTDDIRGYHYHAASPGENMFIGCFHGKTVKVDRAQGGPPGGQPPGGGPPPDGEPPEGAPPE